MLPALALGLLPLAAGAQEQPLPSVSDYHLPTASPRATRASGPVDPSNPVVPVKRDESAAAPAAPASASASPAPARTAKPAPKPSPSASPSRSAEPRRAEEASSRKPPEDRDRTESRNSEPREPDTAKPESSASPEASPPASAGPAMPPVQWNVHSAKDDEATPIWPWLLGIAVLLASNALLLVLLLRRRQRKADEGLAAQQPAYLEEPLAMEPVEPVHPEPASDAPVPPLPLAAEPEQHVAQPEAAMVQVPAEPSAEPEVRPALALVAKPIEVALAARQLSATLMNAVLNYELVVTNLSDDTVGPIIIAGDMIGAHASLPTRSQLEITGSDIEPHHRHAVLHPQEWAKFSGEFRLPLAAITPIRSGRASLFVPLARFRVEVLRSGAPPLVINRTFVIGEMPETPEAALKPFRLDLGPRLYSQIGQREVASA